MHRQAPLFLNLCMLALIAAGTYQSGHVMPRPEVTKWVTVSDLERELAIDTTVFWEPLDTVSLRKLLRDAPNMVRGKDVLEIGTGSGLVALCCAHAQASRVVATDINPHAITCARRNAQRLGMNIDFRRVRSDRDAGAFAVILPHERFDLIISNPPWENSTPQAWADYALYDPSFQLLQSILSRARQHLKPGGKILLAYGCVEAIRAVHRLAPDFRLNVLVLDERDFNDLPDLFLPGLLLGIRPSEEVGT